MYYIIDIDRHHVAFIHLFIPCDAMQCEATSFFLLFAALPSLVID